MSDDHHNDYLFWAAASQEVLDTVWDNSPDDVYNEVDVMNGLYNRCSEWVSNLKSGISSRQLEWSIPFITCNPDMNHYLAEWWYDYRKLSVYFNEDGIEILRIQGCGTSCTIDDYAESSDGIKPYEWLLGLT